MSHLSHFKAFRACFQRTVRHKTEQLAYLGLHGDKAVTTTTGQSRPLDGSTMEKVIVVFEIPDLQRFQKKQLFHKHLWLTVPHHLSPLSVTKPPNNIVNEA